MESRRSFAIICLTAPTPWGMIGPTGQAAPEDAHGGVPMHLKVQQRYLNLPVRDGVPLRHLRLSLDSEIAYAFDVELTEEETDFWVHADLSPWQGLTVTLDLDGDQDSPRLNALVLADEAMAFEGAYREPLRPRFHFTALRGWNNDPNGLLFHDGRYHLFYQHNPFGRHWGNMHWGHALSPDLVHWEELGEALLPDETGTMFSGSGVVDRRNTSSLGTGNDPPLICLYTAAGGKSPESLGRPFTQCLAYSNDRGRTWSKYAGNPVLDHVAGENRDPKVIWHRGSGRWVMALYLEGPTYGLYSSPDLIHWRQESRLEVGDGTECPDLFPLPLDGNPARDKWVFWAANGAYRVGAFDGSHFRPEGEVRHFYHGSDAYAAQTWSDVPEEDGRRLQIAWLRGGITGTPFNQMMTFPLELSLRSAGQGPALFARPAREIARLHRQHQQWEDVPLADLESAGRDLTGDAYHLRARLRGSGSWRLRLRGVPLEYDADQKEVTLGQCRASLPLDGPVSLEALVDRTSLEVFLDDGRLYFPLSVILPPPGEVPALAGEGEARLAPLEMWEL